MDGVREELVAALRAGPPGALGAFERLAPSHQREWLRHIGEAKRPETRERRIARCVAELGKGRRPGA